MKSKKSWFRSSVGGLLLQTLIYHFILSVVFSFILSPFLGSSMSPSTLFESYLYLVGGPLQVILSGIIVGILYRDKFKKDFEEGVRFKISAYYFIIFSIITLIFFFIEESSDFDVVPGAIISGAFIFLLLFAFYGVLIYWSLSWFNKIKKRGSR